MPRRRARRFADALAGAARTAFERWRSRLSEIVPPEEVREALAIELDLVVNSRRALDEFDLGMPADILEPALDGVLTQTAAIDLERRLGGAREDPRFDHAEPYVAVLRDENAARRFLGLPRNDELEELCSTVRGLGALVSDAAALARSLASHLGATLRANGAPEASPCSVRASARPRPSHGRSGQATNASRNCAP